MNREAMTDAQLLYAYIHMKDMGCLGEFLTRHQDPLLRYAAGLLGGDDAAAQDVVQETFMRVMKRPKPVFHAESTRNWLLAMVRNVGIDHLRRQTRHRQHVGKMAETAPGADDHDEVESIDERSRVQRAIDSLAPKHQEVLRLKVEHGKSYREISEITGLTVTNVGFRLHEAMKVLTAKLREKEEAR